MTAVKEQMDAFYAGVGALAEQLGIKSVTMHVQLDEQTGASTWWPGCPKDCPTPQDCAARVFHTVARTLHERVEEILGDTATIVDARHNVSLN